MGRKFESCRERNKFKNILLRVEAFKYEFSPTNPIPLDMRVAKKGIEAKPTYSILTINLNLEAKESVTLGKVPLLNGSVHKT